MALVLRAGETNSLVDVAGLRVGHARRVGGGFRTGTTVVLAPASGAVAGVDVRGAAPGTRETELLDPRNLVERVHAVVLSGGSAFGLSAACGVMGRLADAGVGFPVDGGAVPIVPAAVIFDLGRGGAFRAVPDATLGAAAYDAACAVSDHATSDPAAFDRAAAVRTPHPERTSAPDGEADAAGGKRDGAITCHRGPARGSVGAGTGAVAGGLAGGAGTASAVLPDGTTVAALAVVNAMGSVLDPHDATLAGARYGLPGEFDHLSPPAPAESSAWTPTPAPSFNTTIGVVATDRTLTKAQCGKLAAVAHDGLARAIRPAHTMTDGDTIFGLATCARPAPAQDTFQDVLAAAADVFSRAVADAVLTATGRADAPAYLDVFPSALRSRP
ncbi:P1 family peptidase [Nonomuraea gerenzanensis]|uniref:Possible hydrolase n=1 Tax=Nonomuraea gerenzanensis TaxID=93944 RepID=A0A1M4E8S3_9ACTN|nr:P1 family peptidase [Nonomuraea gerenzanensis]UBU17537.1 P1 family peptidase [Nonomuraea gerenzanensis]SBO95297.1 possible hydrolase [Nonomuraea gerenzanensis]